MINVLIVDDEPFIRQGVKILIDWKEYGFNIADEAADGKEALELLEKNQYDLIITDIKMPHMNGIELIEAIRRGKNKDIKVIVLSGYYEFEYAKQAIKYNVSDYILKPIQKEELVRVLIEFKEEYRKEAARQEKKLHTDKIVLERHLNALCSGIYDAHDISYVKEKLPYYRELRYIMIEVDLGDENFIKLSEEEKGEVISGFHKQLQECTAPFGEYVLLDIDKRNEAYGVGFIYSRQFSREKGISEKEYIKKLQETMKEDCPYNFYYYIGEMVEDISLLSNSFKSAIIARSFQNYKHDRDITYYEETSAIKSNAYGIKKEYMDELVRLTEENKEEEIDKCIDKIYASFDVHNVGSKIININIDYLLCQFLYLAKDLDAEVDQEEVLRYISECAFEQFAARGSAKHFKTFVKEFAGYLSQLRQSNSHGVLKDVEREIEQHYMENLSLKYLSEKYYINSAYLGQLFRKKYGVPFKDYLNNYRLEKASELLIRTNHKVCYIAESVGYNNLDYFINKFVRLKGKTPLQYRKQFLK